MGLFARVKKQEGWLATAFGSEGVSAAVVVRQVEGKPLVKRVGFQPAVRPAGSTADPGTDLGPGPDPW